MDAATVAPRRHIRPAADAAVLADSERNTEGIRRVVFQQKTFRSVRLSPYLSFRPTVGPPVYLSVDLSVVDENFPTKSLQTVLLPRAAISIARASAAAAPHSSNVLVPGSLCLLASLRSYATTAAAYLDPSQSVEN